MRLAVEITTCTTLRTGVGYYTEHLVDALLQTRSKGDEIVLLSNRPPAPDLAERWAPHLRVAGPSVRAVWMQSTVPRMLGEAGADVAVFPNYVVPLASPCPSIIVVHDLAVLRMPSSFTLRKRLLTRAMLRPSVAASPVVATVSEASERDILALLGLPRQRVAVFSGAPHPSCRPANAEEVGSVRQRYDLRRPYVLTVGTLEPRKGLLGLMQAFDRIAAEVPEHQLVVAGARGWRDRRLVRELQSRARGGRVRWLGYVSEQDLAALYTGADLFAFPSTWEGFGLPVLESMACGAPVVASDIPSVREIAGDAVVFVPPNDVAALADAIPRLLRDPERRELMREAGLARARTFSWTHTAEALWTRARASAPSRIQSSLPETERHLPAPLEPVPATLRPREWALLAAVVYADLFDSPLGAADACRASMGVSIAEDEARRLARSPGLSPLLTMAPSGHLVLQGREQLLESVSVRETATREIVERNRKRLSALSRLPFVRSIVLSGGVALRNPGARPDVDLFVIAAPGHAYTAYTMLFLATKLTGTRRVICPNYLVDESELAIVYHRDLFTAHQLQSAVPFSGQATYERWCEANAGWVRRFFPGFAPRAMLDSSDTGERPRVVEALLSPRTIESVLRFAWRLRLRRRTATVAGADVVLADGIVKLHLSDYRKRVLSRFGARLEELRSRDVARQADVG